MTSFNHNLGNELLAQAGEINSYANTHEGEYALRKTNLMLGRLAAKYSDVPIFASTSISLVPQEEGVGVGLGEFTGKIQDFTFISYPSSLLTPDVEHTGVVLNMTTPKLNDFNASTSNAWRLNVLPEVLRDPSIDGFVIGIPLVEGQNIMQIGETDGEVTVDSLSRSAEQRSEYSYLRYVQQARALLGQRPAFNPRLDAARLRAMEKIMYDIVFECPYLGEVISIRSDYLRSPKPNGEAGFKVGSGAVSGVLRKFIYDTFEDYRTREWKSDVQAVLYSPEVALLVVEGKISAQEADLLPSTRFVPLSEPHVLMTADGVKS
jgi:hypothetical protein